MSEPYRFAVQAKSIGSDPWGDPMGYYEDLDDAAASAYSWFDNDGWYSRVLDTYTDEVLFVDYNWTEEGQARFE